MICEYRLIKLINDKNQSFYNFLELIPDELDDWVCRTAQELENDYAAIETEVKNLFNIFITNIVELPVTKKSFAEWCKLQNKMYQSILFKMFECKDYSSIIWKYIKPKYQKPFQNK